MCPSLAAARVALTHPFDLVLTSLQFDESRMFDLLRYANGASRAEPLPVVCVKTIGEELHVAEEPIMVMATKAYGARGYVDLSQWVHAYGEKAAFSLLRHLIDRVVQDRRHLRPVAASV